MFFNIIHVEMMTNVMKLSYYPFVFYIMTGMLFVCNTADAQDVQGDQETYMSDPIEPVNRWIWDFNYYVLDAYIYRPVTEAYVEWVPDGGRLALNNFVLNLEEPSTLVNNILLLQPKYAGDALLRFTFNSTFGILGLFDVAKDGGVARRPESFSNVLGHWHVPNGAYLMLPVMGPRSVRTLAGSFVDGLYFPGSYFNYWQTGVLWGIDGLDKRESLLGQEVLLEQSLDPYIFVKEAYIQYEAFKFHSNSENINEFIEQQQKVSQQQTEQDLNDFMDEID